MATTENIAVSEETVAPANPEAYRELSVTIKSHIRELEESDNPPKKTLKRLEDIQAHLLPVRVLLNEKIAKGKAARTELAEAKKQNIELQEIVDKEPVQNVLQIRRLPSLFSGVTADNYERAPIDPFYVESDPIAVSTRIKSISKVEYGVVGIKIWVTDTVSHVILFPDLIAVAEARDGRVYNTDRDSADSLKIYLEGMSLAVSIADAYTKQYGAFSTIPFDNHQAEENSRVGDDLVVSPNIQAVAGTGPTEEESDENSDEDDADGAVVSDEELERRLNDGDGDDDADESDDLASDE